MTAAYFSRGIQFVDADRIWVHRICEGLIKARRSDTEGTRIVLGPGIADMCSRGIEETGRLLQSSVVHVATEYGVLTSADGPSETIDPEPEMTTRNGVKICQ